MLSTLQSTRTLWLCSAICRGPTSAKTTNLASWTWQTLFQAFWMSSSTWLSRRRVRMSLGRHCSRSRKLLMERIWRRMTIFRSCCLNPTTSTTKPFLMLSMKLWTWCDHTRSKESQCRGAIGRGKTFSNLQLRMHWKVCSRRWRPAWLGGLIWKQVR